MKRLFSVLALVAMLFMVLPVSAQGGPEAGPAKKSSAQAISDNYIVQMIDAPVVSYRGGVNGLKATKAKAGQKIDPYSPEVVQYASYLDGKHQAAVDRVGGKKFYDYRFSFNGFAAKLTEDQVAALAQVEGVVAVTKDEIHEVDTSSTPDFLGLTAKDGIWQKLGGINNAGEGVIVGIIDTGIWPENPSFSDRVGTNGNGSKSGKLGFQQIPGWHGKCKPGEEFTASMCNQKLIGAQWFNEGWGGDAGVDATMPWEFNSARDYNGHGSHTASTAAGNAGVQVTGPGAIFGAISGIAPHARIAVYKALWMQPTGTGSGTTSDLVAAIDQAVADGVDVINYSISGSQTNFRDPVEIAFLYAADAGVFVAASAGNSGPNTSTVAHPSPWITTVAAGTHNRDGQGSVTLGNGATYYGASLAMPVSAPLIDSTAAALPGADPALVALCYATVDTGGTPVLDPAKVAGKIVVCDRGVTARVNKSLAVQEAGGVGMILVNTSLNSLNADFHSIPTVHLQDTDRAAVKAYAATEGATALINKGTVVYTVPAPYTASFSSRGPLRASGDLLKPDLIAPGQDILAAVAPPGNSGLDYSLYSGTSMSSPHVAGLAALFKQLYPTWTPMMIKSALMTTGSDILDGPNTHPLVIFRQGAGHVQPNKAMNPGLVFNSGWNDWLGFLCGTQLPTSFCINSGIPVLDPSDFNSPSVAIAELAGSQTVTRTVTNMGGAGTYTFSYSGLAGINVSVKPETLTFTKAGQTAKVEITFTNVSAPLNAYVGGQLSWTDGARTVRIPAVVRPVALAAPAQVSGSYSVTFGYTGEFTATPRGLVAAQTFNGSISTGERLAYQVTVPAGTTYARFSLFDSATSPASDLDLEVYRSNGSLVGSSGGSTSDEVVNVMNPAADTYIVIVDGFATANPTKFTLFAWVLDSANAGNMVVSAPTSATLGQTGTIGLSFIGLTPGVKYLGSVVYGGASGMPNPTIVRVDP